MQDTFYWSPTTKLFYPQSMFAAYKAGPDGLPSDLRSVTYATFEAYGLTNAPEGQQRGVDASGNPAWVASS